MIEPMPVKTKTKKADGRKQVVLSAGAVVLGGILPAADTASHVKVSSAMTLSAEVVAAGLLLWVFVLYLTNK